MQNPSTGEMTKVRREELDELRKTHPNCTIGEAEEKVASRKGEILWRIGENFDAGGARFEIVEIVAKEKKLIARINGNGPVPQVGEIRSAKGMDFCIVSRDQELMEFGFVWVGKSKGIAGMMSRLQHNEVPKRKP